MVINQLQYQVTELQEKNPPIGYGAWYATKNGMNIMKLGVGDPTHLFNIKLC